MDGDAAIDGIDRPFLLFGGGGDFGFGDRDAFDGGLLGLVGVLIFGSQPADQAVAFFFGALGVEVDEVFEDLFVGDGVRPAVGVEDGGVELVVDVFEDANKGAIVVVAVFVGEGFPGSEFFEQVIHSGDGDVWMGGLYLFAMGI